MVVIFTKEYQGPDHLRTIAMVVFIVHDDSNVGNKEHAIVRISQIYLSLLHKKFIKKQH